MIDVLILTKNEEVHIERCLNNLLKLTNSIYVLDSYSTDKTLQIVEGYTKNIFFRKFDNYSNQFNWAINEIKFKNEWILRIDADEFLSEELINELKFNILKSKKNTYGFYLKRVIHFLGKKIIYGDYFPTYIMRVWRKGYAFCSDDLVDEQLILKKGSALKLSNLLIEKNDKGLSFWINKHVNYANLESSNYHNYRKKNQIQISSQLKLKKYKIYYKFPIFLRPFIYFVYRLIIKRGYKDGLKGILFHFLQSLLYRFLVDILIFFKFFRIKK